MKCDNFKKRFITLKHSTLTYQASEKKKPKRKIE